MPHLLLGAATVYILSFTNPFHAQSSWTSPMQSQHLQTLFNTMLCVCVCVHACVCARGACVRMFLPPLACVSVSFVRAWLVRGYVCESMCLYLLCLRVQSLSWYHVLVALTGQLRLARAVQAERSFYIITQHMQKHSCLNT